MRAPTAVFSKTARPSPRLNLPAWPAATPGDQRRWSDRGERCFQWGRSQGFLKNCATFTTIEIGLPGSTLAFGINDAAQIVGDFHDATGDHGFLATPVPEPATLLAFDLRLVGLCGGGGDVTAKHVCHEVRDASALGAHPGWSRHCQLHFQANKELMLVRAQPVLSRKSSKCIQCGEPNCGCTPKTGADPNPKSF
jgi:hypothetical protein